MAERGRAVPILRRGTDRQSDQDPQRLVGVTISWQLKSAVRNFAAGLPDQPSADLLAEATFARNAYHPVPVTPAAIVAWLEAIAAGVNDAPAKEALASRAAMVLMACQDTMFDQVGSGRQVEIDGRAFSQDSAILALRHFDRWPSVAALHTFLARYMDDVTTWIDTLDGMLAAHADGTLCQRRQPLAIGHASEEIHGTHL